MRLLRALYGLRISPRTWYETYKDFLVSSGWEICPKEPGLFRRSGYTLSIYVDDTLLTGPCESELKKIRTEILNKFPGKIIKPDLEKDENGDTIEIRDILGVTHRYIPKRRWMKLSMEGSIKKILTKFKMENAKARSTPCVNSSLDEGRDSTFPLRELVGALQYVQSMGRPDVSFAVQRLSRCVTNVKESTVTAGKRVLAYLKGTLDWGIEYSPESEKAFYDVYKEVASRGGHDDVPHSTAFADADFAGCTTSLKSTSGSILYYRGTPIAWKARRQTIRALSTCESEYVAIFDTIQLSRQQGWLEWFEEGRDLPLIFSDSQSALALTKNSIITKKSKHMSIRYHEVKDRCKDLCFVSSGLNRADPLTKPLHGGKYLALFKNELSFDSEKADSSEFSDSEGSDINLIGRVGGINSISVDQSERVDVHKSDLLTSKFESENTKNRNGSHIDPELHNGMDIDHSLVFDGSDDDDRVPISPREYEFQALSRAFYLTWS